MLEAKVMLAMMIQRFSFELVPGQKHAPDIAITMRSAAVFPLSPPSLTSFSLDRNTACG